MKPTLKTNLHLAKLIEDLKELAKKEKSEVWKKAAKYLSYPTRKKIETNLTKLDKETKENDKILFPGKVLNGELNHKLTVSSFQISESAKEKVDFVPIQELMKKNPKATGVKLMA